ncbi:hypothetical protein ACSMXM_10595 [Pacificimonas sp. ICDLI1SI03]
MLPLVPDGLRQAAWLQSLMSVTAFLVLFWMPYLFIRAMTGEARPGRPTLGFLFFVGVAILLALVQAIPVALSHVVFAKGVSQAGAQMFILAAGVLSALLSVRLLPLYAGTATQSLSPFQRYWWAGLRGSALSLAALMVGGILIGAALQILIPEVGSAFTLGNILLSHAEQSVRAAGFLALCGVSLAAAAHCAQLQGAAPPR